MTSLPAPRRIVLSHQSSGEPETMDDSLTSIPITGGGTFSLAYVHKGMPFDTANAMSGTSAQADGGSIQSDGSIAVFCDIPPGAKTPMHYTDSLDYLIVVHGELKLTLHDGTTKIVKAGDLVVQTAAVHQWSNETSEPARTFNVVLPSKPREIDGKRLDEALGAKNGAI